jgi:signal transduction histidine kinase
MISTSLLLLITGAANLGIGVYVMSRAPQSLKHQAFFIFALGTSLWIGGFGLLLLTEQPPFINILNVGGAIMLLGIYLLALIFLDVQMRGLVLITLAPFPIAFAIAGYPSLLVSDVTYLSSGVVPTQGWIFPYYAVWFIFYTLLALALMAVAYRRAAGPIREQLQYLFLGIGSFVAIATLCDVILPALGIFSLNFAGPAASLISIVATGYAITRHNLLDIRLVIQRGAVYMSILLTILASYVLGIAMMAQALHARAVVPSLLVIVVALVIGVFGSRSIERKVESFLQPILFENPHSREAGLERLSKLLTSDMPSQTLLPRAAGMVKELLQVEWCFIVEQLTGIRYGLTSESSSSIGIPYALRIPMRVKKHYVGELVLGAKRSGEAFTNQERVLMRTIARLLAVVVAEEMPSSTSPQRARLGYQDTIDELSHALQSPLTALKSGLGMLRTGMHEPSSVAYERMEITVDRMSHMIRTMLELSRTGVNSSQELLSCDASRKIEYILEYVRIIAEVNDIELFEDIAPGIVIKLTKQQFEEVATNIISNSLRYTAGCPKRSVRVALTHAGHDALLTVSDSGIGIAEEEIPYVYGRFYRSANTTNRPGTGLGLAIVKRIIDECNGTIQIESEVGAGTTVMVCMPSA